MSSCKYKVALDKIINEFGFEVLYMPGSPKSIYINSSELKRSGLELAGFFEHYRNDKILLIGQSEHALLSQFDLETRNYAIEQLIATKPPAIILSCNLHIFKQMITSAKKHHVAILRSNKNSSNLLSSYVYYMTMELAPRITRHGVLMEIYDEGVMIVGDSGIGKSETAIELIKRGHRLIADDSVEIRRVSDKSLIGTSPENIRHFIELRGIGIINAMKTFGINAVKIKKTIDIIIHLEMWDDRKVYDRIGTKKKFVSLMGIKVPIVTIPVKPGRNLSSIIEVAIMNNRQNKMGYNSARELLSNLGMEYDEKNDYEIEVKNIF